MRNDPTGEVFWDTVGKMAVGAAIGAATYAVSQLIAGEPINAAALARSAGEGAITAVTGTVAGALISGFIALNRSLKDGNDRSTAVIDGVVAAGSALIGGGGRYIGGRIKLNVFKGTATTRELKALGRSLQKTKRNGNELRKLTNWDKTMNRLGTRHFMNSSYARYYGYLASSSTSITASAIRGPR